MTEAICIYQLWLKIFVWNESSSDIYYGHQHYYHFSISYNTFTEPEPADLQWSGQKLQLTDVLWYNILTNSIYGVWGYIAIYVII